MSTVTILTALLRAHAAASEAQDSTNRAAHALLTQSDPDWEGQDFWELSNGCADGISAAQKSISAAIRDVADRMSDQALCREVAELFRDCEQGSALENSLMYHFGVYDCRAPMATLHFTGA